MARIQSPVWNIARGSIAGTTYTANQYHQIIARARTAPVQPNTSFQSAIKSAFSDASTRWKALSSANRTLWESYSHTVVFSGPFGDYHVPGRQLHAGGVTLINYINNLGLGAITIDDNPPGQAGRLILGNVIPAIFDLASNTGVAVSFLLSEEAVEYNVLVEISPGFNASRTRYKGPFLPASAQLDTNTGLLSVKISFSGLVEGQAYFMRLRAVQSDDPCRYSEAFIVRSIAVAVGP